MISFSRMWKRTSHPLRAFGMVWLNFLYPPLCRSCGVLLHDGEHQICSACWSDIPRISHEHPLFQDTHTKLLSSQLVHGLVSVFVFEKQSAFQSIVHALKYDQVRSLGIALGREIGFALRNEGVPADFVAAVPLHRRKFRERGYNQSDYLVEGIVQTTEITPLHNLIVRTRDTRSQTTLNLEQRRKNVQEAFSLHEHWRGMIDGKTFILVDDVITTGATIEACAQILLNHGAERIIAASAALAAKDS